MTPTCRIAIITGLVLLFLFPALADGPNFRADYIFRGSSLTGWRPLGQATWKAQNNEIVGTPRAGGGWLLLDKSFSNVGVYAEVMCTGGCKAGMLFRAEKTADGGMKGIYVSLTGNDLGAFAVKIDAQGREVSRAKLQPGNGDGGLASTMGNSPPEITQTLRDSKITPLPAGISLPELERPVGKFHAGAWNQIDVLLYGDALHPYLNGARPGPDSPLANSIAPNQDGSYGPIALYVGGSGEARFRNVRYKDLLAREIPVERVGPNFEMRRLSDFYYSWTAAIADINRDGHPDVIAGPYYYLGPDFTTAHEFYTPVVYNPATEYPQVSIVSVAYDFTGDGWPDILLMSGNAGISTVTLYVNPRGESRHWDHYVVLKRIGNEETLLKDIDGDGKPELIHSLNNNVLAYSKPDPANPTGPWKTTIISEPGPWGTYIGHGLGVGDINGDGRMDFINCYGWWEQPAKGSGQKLWTYHPAEFGRWGYSQGGPGGAEIGVYDVNGDGLNDVVTSMEGHAFGLAWFEQKRDAEGKISFVRHMIMDNFLTKNAGNVIFTEPHATSFADMNGDGIPDLIVGKRPMSHLFSLTDPDPFGAPVVYVYRTVRNPKAPGGAEFVPELVDNNSGVGASFAVADLNGDGTPDIAVSGAMGTFIFFNKMKAQTKTSSLRQ